MDKNIHALIRLYEQKKKLDKDYQNALDKCVDQINRLQNADFPIKIGVNGYEFIKNKDGKIFFRKYAK